MDKAILDKLKNALKCIERPIYETLIDSLLQMIKSGELPEGTKFPPDKKLAIELGINHITLAKSLNELRRRGVLDRRRSSGTSVPAASAQNIADKISKKIAVVFDYASEITFQQKLFIELYRGLKELNCNMLFYSSDNDADKQKEQLIEIMQDITVSGCIVWSILDEERAKEVLKHRPRCYPLIFLDKFYSNLEHDAVVYNNFACASAMARSVIRHKACRCIWVEDSASKDSSSIARRREGFMSGWKNHGDFTIVDINSADVISAETPEDCALICADGVIAGKVLKYLNEHKLAVPKLSYVFGTDVDCAEKSSYFTIYKFSNELGKDAVNILAARLNGKESCTVNHSGKWSVLAAKKNKKGVKNEKQP